MNLTKYFIQLSSIKPLSNKFGFDRGVPIDRYYIEKFLNKNQHLISGNVLEIADSFYTKKIGGEKVTNAFVFNNEEAEGVDFVGDLVSGIGVKENIADCFIMTQTLPFIFDLNAAVENALKMILPGGHLLITVSGITPISRYDYEKWGHFWSFTEMSLKKILEGQEVENLVIESYGNVKAACAFLYGMATHELKQKDLDFKDNNFQMLISAVLKKKGK